MARTRMHQGELVGRNGNVILPHLDPKFNPSHPFHSQPPIDEDPYFPLSPSQRKRLERRRLEEALAEWDPPHVTRSYENDSVRATRRLEILRLDLSPRPKNTKDLIPSSPNDSSLSRRASQDFVLSADETDFRTFAVERLHLGYHRLHHSNDASCPTEFVLETLDDPDIPPEDICWILEYTENECNIIRRKLAGGLGLFPAVIDPKNPIHDPEIAWRYDRRLYARCRRKSKRCIRPSHIEIFTSTFAVLP